MSEVPSNFVSRDLVASPLAEPGQTKDDRLREAVLEAAPCSIIATDNAGLILSVNPATERMLWYRRDELIGKLNLASLHDASELRDRATEIATERSEIIAAGFESLVHSARSGIVEEREWTYVRIDGSRFPVHLSVAAFRDKDGDIAGFVGIAYDVTERRLRDERAQRMAHHDPLTGLPNRNLLADRLHMAQLQAQRSGRSVVIMMIDLDHLKRINDTLGHHVGDQVLIAMSVRLQANVRRADTVSRLGGDEFVLVLPDIEDIGVAERIARNLLSALSEPVIILGHTVHMTPCIGISLYPQHGTDGDTLLRKADTAMYQAKAAGRCDVRLFIDDMEFNYTEKLGIKAAMHQALAEQSFVIHYQPTVNLANGEVSGMEALVRWLDPVRGMVLPARFIPIAEESGLILSIGEWVLRTACAQAVLLQRQTGRELRLCVNVSPRQFVQPNFLAMVHSALGESGLPAEQLELEITEGILMSQTDTSIAKLSALRESKIGVAIDDFGVGFSSLAYITRFPISTLKIDRSFVSQLPGSSSDSAVVQTIITLAKSLDVRVVGEGVETQAQCDLLREQGCHSAQGHWFSEAVSFDRFPAMVESLQQRLVIPAAPESDQSNIGH